MPVTWSGPAQADFIAISKRALDEDPRYALGLVDSLDQAIGRLSDFPGLGTPVGMEGQRNWRLAKTPFLLVYAVSERGKLHILRVYHGRPGWQLEP